MQQILINGDVASTLNPTERGFQYGDGLFETMAVQAGEVPLWRYHWQRLGQGCERLQLPLPDEQILLSELQKLTQGEERAVLKLIYSRGVAERGYQFPAKQAPTRVLYRSAWPDYPADHARAGVRLKICQTRLGLNPYLAGIKHLNRLEQVLARNEWQDDSFQEGVMLDTAERVIEGTMSNLFWVKAGQLFTPDLSDCGVLGIMRQRVLEEAEKSGLSIRLVSEPVDTLFAADEVFITNSLIGIWPVNAIEAQQFRIGPVTQQLQQLV